MTSERGMVLDRRTNYSNYPPIVSTITVRPTCSGMASFHGHQLINLFVGLGFPLISLVICVLCVGRTIRE
jgi:hypothetical protein